MRSASVRASCDTERRAGVGVVVWKADVVESYARDRTRGKQATAQILHRNSEGRAGKGSNVVADFEEGILVIAVQV